MTDLLREIPENPIPQGLQSGQIKTKDGPELRYARLPASAPHGTAILLQGRNEAAEKYFETMQDLAKLGFGSVTLDWRGQGGSSRLLRNPLTGHIPSFDAYVQDLDQFFREVVLPDCRPPYHILAHSMGGLIALLASPLMSNRVQRMVLLAPLLAFKERVPQSRIHLLSKLWCSVGLGSRFLPATRNRGQLAAFAGNEATSDQSRFERNLKLAKTFPELTIGGPSAAWVRSACDAMQRVTDPAFMAANRIPTLFIAAGSDKVVSTGAIEHYARRIRSGHCLTIDGARHELLQESDIFREQAMAAFEGFAAGKMQKPAESER
jgi:lysophospholipase